MTDEPQEQQELQDGEPDAIPMMVPTSPWTVDVHNSMTHYQPLPNGGMLLQFTPALVAPTGQVMPVAPSIRVWFSKDGWEAFQREVEAGGVKSRIQRATVLPAGAKI